MTKLQRLQIKLNKIKIEELVKNGSTMDDLINNPDIDLTLFEDIYFSSRIIRKHLFINEMVSYYVRKRP